MIKITQEHFKCYRPLKLRFSGKSCYYRKGLGQEWARYIPFGNMRPGFKMKVFTQGFGENRVPFYKQSGMKGHNGIDWRAFTDTCLYSPIDGTIYDVKNSPEGYGKYIRIKSDTFNVNGIDYYFMVVEGHLNQILAKKGDKVKHGDFIALTDNTGLYTTGAHLHEGFRLYKKVNNKWTLDYDNGYKGYVDHESLIVNPSLKYFKCFSNTKPYLQIIDGVGGFYKKDGIDLEVLSSKKNPATRHIPLVDEVIHILNEQKLNEGVTTEEYNQIILE